MLRHDKQGKARTTATCSCAAGRERQAFTMGLIGMSANERKGRC